MEDFPGNDEETTDLARLTSGLPPATGQSIVAVAALISAAAVGFRQP